jgi:hypothetical protein
MILGELGRFIDMSPQNDVFTNAIEHFAAEQEEIRTAAAFAAGLHFCLSLLISTVAQLYCCYCR